MVHARQDISTDWDAVRRVTGAPASKVNVAQDEMEKIHGTTPYQKYVYGICQLIKPQLVVITGRAFSVEPIASLVLKIPENSYHTLHRAATEDQPWDLFVHDGEHDIFTQTFEMEFAWRMLRQRGLLIVNAYTWAEHGAFEQFLIRKRRRFYSIGGAAIVMKPSLARTKEVFRAWEESVNIAVAISTCTEK